MKQNVNKQFSCTYQVILGNILVTILPFAILVVVLLQLFLPQIWLFSTVHRLRELDLDIIYCWGNAGEMDIQNLNWPSFVSLAGLSNLDRPLKFANQQNR